MPYDHHHEKTLIPVFYFSCVVTKNNHLFILFKSRSKHLCKKKTAVIFKNYFN